MASALDGDWWVIPCSRDMRGKQSISTVRDGVGVRERAQERLVITAERRPGRPIRRGCRVGGAGRDQHGEFTGTSLKGVVGERCVVACDDRWGEVRHCCPVDNAPDVEDRSLLAVLLPGKECLTGTAVASGQKCVGGDNPGEQIWIFPD